MNLRNLCKNLALYYHKYQTACKPSEHCYFKGKYKAYMEVIIDFYGMVTVVKESDDGYRVMTNTGYYRFYFD